MRAIAHDGLGAAERHDDTVDIDVEATPTSGE
jgi:hypothetical protein